MATVQCSWSGEPITTSWYDTSSGAGLDITNVTYDTSTGKITVSWNMYLRQYSSSSGRYNFIGGYASIGGTQVAWDHASNYGTYWTYSNWYDGKSFASGSTTFNATTSLSLYCKAMFNYGYTDTRWNNGTGCVAGSGTLYITLPSGPTINSASVSASGSTTANYTCSVSAGSASISSYSWSIAGQSKSGSSGSVSSLSPYTTYNWSLTVTDANSMTASTSGTFTTNRSSYPTYTASYSNISRTGATLNLSVSSNPDSWWKFHFYNQNGTWVTCTSIGATSGSYTYSGLSPNTRYTMYIRYGASVNGSDAFVQDPASSWSFTTSCNAPSSLTITRSSSTTTSVSGTVSATGDTNAPITNYTLYYRPGTSGSYTAVNLGTSTSFSLSSLSVDTNYNIYFTATNAGGTSTSSTVTYSTLLTNPTISDCGYNNLLPFSCDSYLVASVSPSRTLTYAFSNDGGSTWTSYQSSSTYSWTGLSEETTYNMGVRVKATHIGTNASDTYATNYYSVITPADQAKIRIKNNGTWVQGKTYAKINGTWTKAKKIYRKVNGQWVIGKND